MNNKIEIIKFNQSVSFPSCFIKDDSWKNNLEYNSLRIALPYKEKIKNKSKLVLTTESGKHITGLSQIKGIENVYYGDIKGETAAIFIFDNGIEIVIFRGHRPKLEPARQKKVINYINSLLKSKNKG